MRSFALPRPTARTAKWTGFSLVILAGFAVLGVSMSHETPERAQAHLERGDPEAALHELKHSGPFLFFSADYHALKARAQQMLGQLDEAEKSLAWALWLDEDNAQYYKQRSDIRRSLSSRDEYRAYELGLRNDRRRYGFRGDGDWYGPRYDEHAGGRGGRYGGYDGPGPDFDPGQEWEDGDQGDGRSRWERGRYRNMRLWGEDDHPGAPLSEDDRRWVQELEQLGEAVREQQSTPQAFGPT